MSGMDILGGASLYAVLAAVLGTLVLVGLGALATDLGLSLIHI